MCCTLDPKISAHEAVLASNFAALLIGDIAVIESDPKTETGLLSHTRWEEIEVEQLNPLIGRQFVVGADTMLARVLLKKGAVVPLHQHPNEQISYILEGALKFFIDGKEIVVGAGEVLCIPPNMPHEAHALEDTVDLDIFNPPRQDWIDRNDAYLRGGR
jgi:quercetin dioxygenase-like cupin family protein